VYVSVYGTYHSLYDVRYLCVRDPPFPPHRGFKVVPSWAIKWTIQLLTKLLLSFFHSKQFNGKSLINWCSLDSVLYESKRYNVCFPINHTYPLSYQRLRLVLVMCATCLFSFVLCQSHCDNSEKQRANIHIHSFFVESYRLSFDHTRKV